jgi:CheY-like chemotaxis protein
MESVNIINILHLEDNETDAQLIQLELKKSKVKFEYFFADNEKDYLSYLENQKIDIILSDYHLPDYSGIDALLVVKNYYPFIPFVFVSGTMGEDAAVESLLNGATDYVLKNRLERLGSAVQRAFKEA